MEKTLQCNLCEKELSCRSSLNRHILSHHEGIRPVLKKNVKCSLCDYKFATRSGLRNHMRTHTHERPFKCTVNDCGMALGLRATLNDHIKYKHSDGRPFKCLVQGCLYSGKTAASFLQHQKKHSDDRPFSCPSIGCNFQAKTRRNIKDHFARIHDEVKAFACPECHYKAAQKYALDEHVIRRHSTRRDFKCSHPQCTESFKSFRDLKLHFSNRHEERNIQCDYLDCGRKYANARAMKMHKRSAHSQKNHVCGYPTCHYSTNTERNLSSHMIVHYGRNEKISCSIKGCEFKGKNMRTVKAHMRRHQTQFKCPESGCNRFARSKQALSNHMKSHNSKGRPFKCPFCFKRYQTRDHLKRHTLSHTIEKPFRCGHCDFGSFERLRVKSHICCMHANLKFPFISIPLQDRECISCNVTLPLSEFVAHSMTHGVPFVQIERLEVRWQ